LNATDRQDAGKPYLVLSREQASVKAKQLRQTRWLASSLLGVMLLILAISATFQARYPWLHWLRAFAEAGTVGALADWYAVTALFRHPLGLAIPHTAIIPTNKDKIGESLGEFVEQNFLTAENITEKLRQHDVAQALAKWLTKRENSLAVASAVSSFVPALLNGVQDRQVRQFFDHALWPQLLRLNVPRVAGNVLSVLIEGDRHQALLDRALHALERWIVARQGLIEAKFSEASRYTPRGLDNYVVQKFLAGIVALLHEIVENPRHELRAQFDQAVRELIHEMTNSNEYCQKGQALMRRLVEHMKSEDFYQSLWRDIKTRVTVDLASDTSLITEQIAAALVAISEHLLEEGGVRQRLNAWWLDAIRKIVLRFRNQISGLITDVVRSWDSDEVSRKVEIEIGKDLQYIRVNGTLVGGAVGLLLHAAILIAGTTAVGYWLP